MPSFGDSIFIFVLALILFGPKKLPEIARWMGKLMAEFRRASNEFRIQMEDELRMAEQADTQKKLAAIATPAATEVAADATAAASTDGTEADVSTDGTEAAASAEAILAETFGTRTVGMTEEDPSMRGEGYLDTAHYGTPEVEERLEPIAEEAAAESLPIATAGDISIHPPATGLPVAAQTITENKND